MVLDPTKWCSSHKNAVRNYFKSGGKSLPNTLPKLPLDPLKWIDAARPQVDGIKRSFIAAPFWVPIYTDPHNFQMTIGGRQIYKSTACTDFLALEATANPFVQVCYVTHDEPSLSAFSKQKMQVGTFMQNPVLAKFPRHRMGNVHEISLKNGSTIYLVTHNYQYKHVEGKSLNLCLLDEAQYQDIQHLNRVHQTMMATKGKIKILGIGGPAGSPYEKLWKSTNQMEWFYDDQNWRDRLQFDSNGLVIGEYLKDVLSGKWIAQNPSSTDYHGYHLPQTIFPTIPLTKEDAITKYQIHPRFSIEYQQETMEGSTFITHVLGSFFHSSHRPITREMVLSCMNPYPYLPLLGPEDVVELKNTFTNEIKVAMGVDFGSGAHSDTAIVILISWAKTERIQIAWIEKRPRENQLKQAQYIAELFLKYGCDIGVGDLGYGAIQVKQIQDGGYDNDTGSPYPGVGNTKFFGCRTISDETKPLQSFDKTIDEHGEQVGRIQMDKTAQIDSLINTLERSILHPYYPADTKKARRQLMIPSKRMYEVDYLLNDMTAITRKDLDKISDSTKEDGRQKATKVYNHPPDSVMAIIYGLVGLKHEIPWHWISA